MICRNIFLLTLFLPVVFARPALGQQLLIEATRAPEIAQSSAVTKQIGAWTLICNTGNEAKSAKNPAGKRCLMRYRYLKPGSAELVFEVSGEMVRRAKSKFHSLVLVIRVPLGLLLTKGITIQVDKGRKTRLAMRSCHAGGCLVPVALRGKLLRKFLRGRNLKLTFYGLDGKPVTYTMSLEGFYEGYKALKE